jgi:hypothetical protein
MTTEEEKDGMIVRGTEECEITTSAQKEIKENKLTI